MKAKVALIAQQKSSRKQKDKKPRHKDHPFLSDEGSGVL